MGKVGSRALQSITQLEFPANTCLKLVLMASERKGSIERLQGFAADLHQAFSGARKEGDLNVIVTSNYMETQGSDLVICSAGNWPSEKQSSINEKSGRLVQTYVNAEMIKNIAIKLNESCPDSLLLMVTNQVDMMCHIARKFASKMKVLGLTGGVDSARLKDVINEEMSVYADSFMIGYHNQYMIPLLKSLTIRGKPLFPLLTQSISFKEPSTQHLFEGIEKNLLNKVTKRVIEMGKNISDLQKTGNESHIDTGASILPAIAISEFVSAYCFDKSHIQSYNVFIDDESVALHYGVPVNTELSIPLQVNKLQVSFDTSFELSKFEKEHLKLAQETLNQLNFEIIEKI